MSDGFIVYAERGEYSDYGWMLMGVYATANAAEAHRARCEWLVDRWRQHYLAEDEPEEWDASEPLQALAREALPHDVDRWLHLESSYEVTFSVCAVGGGPGL